MLPTRRLETYLQFADPELRDIVLELRSLISTAAPGVTEWLRRFGLTYYFAERGGPVSAGLCQISLHADHVQLAFIHGAFLPDPRHLLTGRPRYKRHLKLYSFEQTPWEAVQALLEASARFDPRTAPTAARP